MNPNTDIHGLAWPAIGITARALVFETYSEFSEQYQALARAPAERNRLKAADLTPTNLPASGY